MIQTIIVDDEILSRIGIQSFFDGQTEITVCGTFSSAVEAIEYLRKKHVDIVITDIEMSEINGLEFIEVIRQENLAVGIIIVSCHADFSYAQEAISKGTDSYVLKHSISRDAMISEVKKVYQKRHRKPSVTDPAMKGQGLFINTTETISAENEYYGIAVIRVEQPDKTAEDSAHMQSTMLVHLLEGIVNSYQMGNVFAPYDREIFVIFQFPETMDGKTGREKIKQNLAEIRATVNQYMNDPIVFGVSDLFGNLQETKAYYEEAVMAANEHFYRPDEYEFFYKQPEEFYLPEFTSDSFLEHGGKDRFEKELSYALKGASAHHMASKELKDQLLIRIQKMRWEIYLKNGLSDDRIQEERLGLTFANAISSAVNVNSLHQNLLKIIGQFRSAVQKELENDDMAPAFAYIESHFAEKLNLSELADICSMSVPTFCKKFKDRTGSTLVQFMNEKRIEHAKALLKNQSYSLWEISEATGFSNANYLIRVFKKVTGQTVSEYRAMLGFDEAEQGMILNEE